MLLSLKVARQLQPSVVYIGECEKTFLKKVPKTDKVSSHLVIQILVGDPKLPVHYL